MDLRDLILKMNECTEVPVLVDDVARILEKSGVRDDIEFVATDMDANIIKGFIHEWEYLPAPYAEPKIATRICYAESQNECWRRYICAKELVHLLDPELAKVNSSEKLRDLMIGMTIDLAPWLREIGQGNGGSPAPVAPSIHCLTDYVAEWLALPVLVPPGHRQVAVEQFNAKRMSDWDVASTLRIPQKFVPFITSDLYEQFVGRILESGRGR